MQKQRGPIETKMIEKLTAALEPEVLFVENESYKHSGSNPESHFKLFIVSSCFQDKSRVDCHRLVNACVSGDNGELPVHALAIKCVTPSKYKPEMASGFKTPPCAGGHD